MYQDILAQRLAHLRTQKGVSARDMSLTIGQSESYINKIECRRTLPSMRMFFCICEYLGVTPKEFFDAAANHPQQLTSILQNLEKLDPKLLEYISGIVAAIVCNK